MRAHGLYAVTSAAICADSDTLLAAVDAALRGGAVWLQYRDKSADVAARHERAAALRALCRRHGAKLLINDDPLLAATVGADGVHLGAADVSIAEARALLGVGAIIGATCGPSLARAEQAADAGADYLAFGRFFASRTKPSAPAAPVELLTEARVRFDLPLCAIGGITPDNAASLLEAGADLLAAVDGVFGAGTPADIEQSAHAYRRCFDRRTA